MYQKFCEGSNQFCKICYFPLLHWWGEKINLGCSFCFGLWNFWTFTIFIPCLFSGSPCLGAHLVWRLPGTQLLPEESADKWDAYRDPVSLPDLARPGNSWFHQGSPGLQKVGVLLWTPVWWAPVLYSRMGLFCNFKYTRFSDIFCKKNGLKVSIFYEPGWDNIEPQHLKTCLRDLRPGMTQTGLLSYRDQLDSQIYALASIGITLSRQRTTKVLIRLCWCAGWSAPLLFTYGINRFSNDMAHMKQDLSQFMSKKVLITSISWGIAFQLNNHSTHTIRKCHENL